MFSFLYFLICFTSFGIVCTKITLENNGYSGILVSISSKVPENPGLLTTIKNWLTEASEKLYIATNQHMYLRRITISIPENWKRNSDYKLVSASSVSKGDIRIGDFNSNKPYVHGARGCGNGGLFLHMSPSTLLDGNNGSYGNLGIVFTHEWGHLRWGLKDEYPSWVSNGQLERFYLHEGTYEPVRCTREIRGQIYNDKTGGKCVRDSNGRPEPDCRFEPYDDTGAIASIMGHGFMRTISQFCDNDVKNMRTFHNKFAPNSQNIICNHRSAWEVMRDHEDFKTTIPRESGFDTTPTFELVQTGRKERICLVIDVSGSMQHIILSVRVQLTSLIRHGIPNNSYVGIVQFSDDAVPLSQMTLVTSDDVRSSLISTLPKTTNGGTSIGAGLQKALEMLLVLGNANGSIIYLASDGKENKDPSIADVLPDIIGNGIVVNTVAITSSADPKLKTVAENTNGLSFFYSKSSNSTAFFDAVSGPFRDISTDPAIQIKSVHIIVPNQDSTAKEIFYIDDTIGRNTVVQFISEILENVQLSVSHNGSENTVIGTSSDTGSIAVIFPGIAKKGEYQVEVKSSTPASGILTVQSKANIKGSDVLQLFASTLFTEVNYTEEMTFPLFVSVMDGLEPVINATVTAEIENKKGHTSSVILKDNAVGADEVADDGTYSGYILSTLISENGRHSIKVKAEGHDAHVVSTRIMNAASSGKYSKTTKTERSIGEFMRTAIVNEIRITNYKPPTPGTDLIPPSKILTLTLSNVSHEEHLYTLEWTAVGDDLDTGQANRYDIRISPHYTNIIDNPDGQRELTIEQSPKVSGNKESFTFKFSEIKTNATYFIVIRAVDEFNNTGEVSNVVTISVLTDISWKRNKSNSPIENRNHLIGIAIGIPIAVLFILMVVILLLFYLKRKRIRSNYPVYQFAKTDDVEYTD